MTGSAQLLASLLTAGVGLVIWLVVVPIGLQGIFEALGTSRSRAWIPFVNLATVYRLGDRSEFWLIALMLPGVDVVGAIMLFVATHRINRRLGRSGWYTVLAVVAWWVWTLALGLQRRIDRTPPTQPLVWSVQQRPLASLVLPGDDGSTSSASASASAPQSASERAAGFIAPMPGMIGRTDASPSAPPAPDASSPSLLPPVASPPQPTPPVGSPAQPANGDRALAGAPQAGASAVPVVEPDAAVTVWRTSSSAPDDDATIVSNRFVDETLISSRRRPHWWVHTTMGARVELTGTSAILGRRPAVHPLYPGAQLIAVTDDALSVSATHAVLEFVGGEWHVTDLDSTNGVWLVDETGAETEVGARNRARVTPTFMLGELGVQVVQGG